MFEGRDLLAALRLASCARIRGKEIAMIFQDPMTSLNPVLTIGRQIREALETHFGMGRKRRDDARGRAARPGRDPERESRGCKDYPHQFSGGMRQRAMIAMALACEPKLLIADEPTTALDVTIQAQILDLLRELVAERDTALILITHDLGVVAGMCERVNVMYARDVRGDRAGRPLFARPRHPYTLGLLQSVPRLDARAAREAAADRGPAAQHAQRRRRVPVRSRAAATRSSSRATEVPAAARDRARPLCRAASTRCRRPRWQRAPGAASA